APARRARRRHPWRWVAGVVVVLLILAVTWPTYLFFYGNSKLTRADALRREGRWWGSPMETVHAQGIAFSRVHTGADSVLWAVVGEVAEAVSSAPGEAGVPPIADLDYRANGQSNVLLDPQ
ncbi:hypothetical protein R6G99_11215, partial [Actinotignum timonense]|nr:hypothetical protein [Actinotignum timonense]